MDPAQALGSLVGRTIVDIALEDDELTITLDDGREIGLYEDDDGDLSMRVVSQETQ
jgi:hypothetical protein